MKIPILPEAISTFNKIQTPELSYTNRKKNPKFYVEPQMTKTNQSNPKRKEYCRHHHTCFQVLLLSDNNETSVVLAQTQTRRTVE